MRGRIRLVVAHWIDSLCVSVIAAAAVLVLRLYTSQHWNFALDGLASRPYLIPFAAGLVVLLLAVAWPARFVASLKSICLLPKHCGACVQAVVGILLVMVADVVYLGADQYFRMDSRVASCTVAALATAAIAGYFLAAWLAGVQRSRRYAYRDVNDEPQSDDVWLNGDRPITRNSDSRFPEHNSTADRILDKLLSERDPESWLVPNVALIGPYGSGKTSICNMVEDRYWKRAEKEGLPRVIFSRFEAWQFLSPEAATAGLVRTVTEKILEEVDESTLWRIPDRYAEAMKECGGQWGKFLIPFLGGSDDPLHILSRIGDTLARLNLRVVVFVDDFDRIEGDSPTTQQAVAKALNQFQAVPNLQYVITVGPTGGFEGRAAEGHVSWDLLKLTRYQELVPRLRASYLVERTKKCRDWAQKDLDYFHPWAYQDRNQPDPLAFDDQFESIYSTIGLVGSLIGLVNTPRACKAMLRETMKAWECGLKGEIDWYDLLLINAIRVAEPGVFEWIARDSHAFFAEVPVLGLPSEHSEEQKEKARYAKELRAQLEATVSTREPKRLKIVKEALSRLFPDFKAAIVFGEKGNRTSSPAEPWSQKIRLQAGSHSDYLRRFFAGCVPPEDVPDQPTLQYIRRIVTSGFDAKEFADLYLDSLQKLTGPLNKVVQFAGLLTPELAYQIGDVILDWIADPAHAAVWPEPEKFMIRMLPDVLTLADQAANRVQAQERHAALEEQKVEERLADGRLKWTQTVIGKHMPTAPLLALAFAVESAKSGWGPTAEQLSSTVFNEFKKNLLSTSGRFLPGLAISRFSLAWLLNDLVHVVRQEDYLASKSDITRAILSEAQGPGEEQMIERVIFSLLHMFFPARDGEIRVEDYRLSVNQAENEARYDMTLILPALKHWTVSRENRLAEKALAHLKHAYALA